jgi:hypothetical protein
MKNVLIEAVAFAIILTLGIAMVYWFVEVLTM